MATEAPLAIEAPKQDPSYIVNENEFSVVPVPTPGPVILGRETGDTMTQKPATSYGKSKQQIPPGFQNASFPTVNNQPPPYTVLAAGEQQSQHGNVRVEREIEAVGNEVHAKNTTQYTEKRQRQQAIVMQDDQGNMRMYKRTITEQRTITMVTEISHTLCDEIYGRHRAIKAREEDYEADATCGEKTVDLCCQSLVCHFQNPFRKNATAIERNQLMNATRRRGRAKGWTILKGLVFPFVSDTARDFWVTFQLLFTFVLVSLSATIFTLAGENYEIFHAVHLALSTLAAFLAILDGIVTFVQCSACKACLSRCRKKSEDNNVPANDKNVIGKAANADFDVEEAPSAKNGCRKCFEASRSGLDIARLLLTEFILVPIIFCDMFEVATGKGFNSNVIYHQIGFALLVFDSIGLIIFVFLLRLVILGRMIRAEQKMHPTQEEADAAQYVSGKTYNIDESIKNNSLKILVVFFLHVFGQTLAHTLMLVAVGAKIAYDTRNYGTSSYISVTSYLWYMMVSAYIVPTLGIGTFFIVNNYWVQQFLIGVCIDFVELLRIYEDTNLIDWSSSEEKPSKAISRFVRMNRIEGMDSLEDEYEEMKDSTLFCNKVGYPFKSPGLVIICILYFAAQLAFVICSVNTIAVTTRGTLTTTSVFLNGGGWVFYVLVASIVGAIINIYTFLVAGIWLAIIAMVIAAIAALIACCICMFMFAGSSDD